jgi:hypothetical protein
MPRDVGCGSIGEESHISGERNLCVVDDAVAVGSIVCFANNFDSGSSFVDDAVDSEDSDPEIDSFKSMSAVTYETYHPASCRNRPS